MPQSGGEAPFSGAPRGAPGTFRPYLLRTRGKVRHTFLRHGCRLRPAVDGGIVPAAGAYRRRGKNAGKMGVCALDQEKRYGGESATEKGSKPDYEELNRLSRIGRVIAVMSGKGGVGKSTVTALLAVELARRGFAVGVLDADITGPSIPKLFGLNGRAAGSEEGIPAVRTRRWGIRVMSMNLLLPREDEAVIWRGPLIGGVIRQFWRDVIWGDIHYLLIDLPPGTGDAPLTVMQSIPVAGLIAVSSPQDLAVMVVKKALRMAQAMEVPVLGLVENMTCVTCPRCGEKIHVFGEPKGAVASDGGPVPLLAALPLDPQLGRLADAGCIEDYVPEGFDGLAAGITGGYAGLQARKNGKWVV